MAIPKEYQNRSVYHFTHVDNLPGILKHGLLSTNEKKRLGIKHTAIAYTEIQSRRSSMSVPCGCGGAVHDYVPLYFCHRTPMLLAVVLNKIADQQLIIHFEFPISIMNQYPCVFTDASANTSIPPNFYDDSNDLTQLNWDIIKSRKWKMPSGALTQARQAELLIHRKIDLSCVTNIIVWNDSIKEEVLSYYGDANVAPPTVGHNEYHYYYHPDDNNESIATGPYFIKEEYKKIIERIMPALNKASSPTFVDLFDMLEAGLRKNLGCLSETKELIGLDTDNSMHSEDVGKHTLHVVSELLKLSEYEILNRTDKLLVEIAAYLHDIGKGPKSRWAKNRGKQKVDHDHPIKALPMLFRILTEEIGTMKSRSAKVICKLVCYHDLIGYITARGRKIGELIDIVEDERELDMLIALSKADTRAVNPAWVDDDAIDRIRTKVKESLKFKQTNNLGRPKK